MDTGLFHVPVIVNNASMNMGVQLCIEDNHYISFRNIPGNGISWSHGSSIFNLGGTSILFSIVAAPVYIPTSNEGSLLSTFSPTLLLLIVPF